MADSYLFGGNQAGVAGFNNTSGVPIDNDTYYTFDGIDDGLYQSSSWGDESVIEVEVKFRIHNKNKGSAQVIWKSGGNSNGIAIGLDASGNLGVFARLGVSPSSIVIPSTDFSNDTWYTLSATKFTLSLKEEDIIKTGSLSVGSGSDNHCVGFARKSSPLSGSALDSDYFDGDIDYVIVYERDSYLFGGYQGGVAGFNNTSGAPVDNNTYYTFDGTDDGLYKGSDYGDETDIEVKAKFRIHDKDKGAAQTIWKSGGNSNGIAIGLDASGNLGIYGRHSANVSSISIPSTDFSNDTWYTLYATQSKILLEEEWAIEKGSLSVGAGSSPESVGFAEAGSPLSYASSDSDYFDGDIDYIVLYPTGGLVFPVEMFNRSRIVQVISSNYHLVLGGI